VEPRFDMIPRSTIEVSALFMEREGSQIAVSIEGNPGVVDIMFLDETMEERYHEAPCERRYSIVNLENTFSNSPSTISTAPAQHYDPDAVPLCNRIVETTTIRLTSRQRVRLSQMGRESQSRNTGITRYSQHPEVPMFYVPQA